MQACSSKGREHSDKLQLGETARRLILVCGPSRVGVETGMALAKKDGVAETCHFQVRLKMSHLHATVQPQ